MDDILREFLVECGEHLDRMEQSLVELENEPGDRSALRDVFRAMHTIKGTCGFFALTRLEEISHAAEHLLVQTQEGVVALLGPGIDALLGVVDTCRTILVEIERTGQDVGVDTGPALRALESCSGGTPESCEGVLHETAAPTRAPDPDRRAALDHAAGSDHVAALDHASEAVNRGHQSTFVRIDVGLLDSLMNLVGELVLVRNRIDELTDGQGLAHQQAAQQLSRITGSLQETVMKGRLEPIGKLFGRLPRVARDLARTFEKRVRVELKGQGTELDRSLIEAITDPITHLLRNALDHGIELPDERRAAGKPEEGTLSFEASQESGQVVVEIRDDGRGIDPDAVRRRAVVAGLCPPERAAQLSDREAIQLIFLPGLSTARRVTAISGRGIGMDVVKSNVEELGGSVDVSSQHGQGTHIRIRLPLTLAIIPAVLVEAGGRRFAIPQGYLCELVRLSATDGDWPVETVHDAPVFRLRDRLLPLVHLGAELGLEHRANPLACPAPADGDRPRSISIAVLDIHDQCYGLVVDRVLDTREVVVKPLGQPLRGVAIFSGACIQGDGSIALILDVARLGARVGFDHERARARAWFTGRPKTRRAPVRRAERLLLVEAGAGRLAVLRLSEVTRLEKFTAAAVETAGEIRVVRYNDGVLPLVALDSLLRSPGKEPPSTDGRLSVVVVAGAHTLIGLCVDRIVDVVEAAPEVRDAGRRPGVLGTVVLRDQVVEFCDTAELVRRAEARCVTSELAGAADAGGAP